MSTPYDDRFYDEVHRNSLPVARTLVPLVLELVRPKSVVDIGCGLGTWLSVFYDHGVKDILGVDYVDAPKHKYQIPLDNFVYHDISIPFKADRQYDLVVSSEVAEHLSEELAAPFIKTLTALGNVVLFSAAIPGQGGTHHVNEQWPDYWETLFLENGFVQVDCLRYRTWDSLAFSPIYPQNLFLYVNESVFSKEYDYLRSLERKLPARIIHPDYYRTRSGPESLGLKGCIRALPALILRSARLRFHQLRSK